jgi:hypothetical protein
MANCLYCRSDGPFGTEEHVIPESLGNKDLVLRGEVCDRCQAYFGKEVEKYVLEKTPIGVWRVMLGVQTKKGTHPSISTAQSRRGKGTLPDCHPYHDGIGFTAHADGTTSADIEDDEVVRSILSGEKTTFNLVLSPKKLQMLGRFLGKVGLGILAIGNGFRARDTPFDPMRRYARYGEFDGIWPIFWFAEGRVEELRTPALIGPDGKTVLEDVRLYSYDVVEVAQMYTLFRFTMGVDNWIICLNDPYPPPIIRSAFPS